MTTQTAKSKKASVKKTIAKKATAKKSVQPVNTETIAEGEYKDVAIAEIDFSKNYRRYYSKSNLEEFAIELAAQGIIIHPLTLRPSTSGRYELVSGERRLRAATMAGFWKVPAMVRVLTDEQVKEIQLAENLQREDPHPMDEAHAVGQMLESRKTIEDVSGRLGKSKTWVYSRIKLLDLIELVQEMFYADVITLQEAYEIASISAASQQEFFEQYCSDWKKQENFRVGNLRHQLSRFKYDLKKAPFNTKDKKLVPDMGACTNCPFNSATLKSLFPEMAEQAICTKKECYQSKCRAHFLGLFQKALKEVQPVALVYDWNFSQEYQQLIDSMEAVELPIHAKNQVSILQPPVAPDKQDFMDNPYLIDDEYEEDENLEIPENAEFDEDSYKAALYEYEADLQEYEQAIQNGELLKALLVSDTQVTPIMISTEVPKFLQPKETATTAKQVQEAIKEGTITPELLQAEITRLNTREQRAKELDIEKIQLCVHTTFMQVGCEPENIIAITDADLIAARLLVYQSLDWSARNTVDAVLFANGTHSEETSFYEMLQNLSERQHSFLIRMAIGCKSDSKFPNNDTGRTLYKVAESAGVDVGTIEAEQQQKANVREQRLKERITEIEKQTEKLQVKTADEVE
ncbi:MAG: ParB/RepB/Spo0J family partition protein [Bacteroidetes bacterium]|nr:ParB/RepB/Spo0J family partition protein [Bacteroidota bacterium]